MASQTARVAHGHSHGGEVSWRPARRVRIALLAALAPFVIATVAGLVVLWPSHHHQPVPLQYQTYGAGKSVYEKGRGHLGHEPHVRRHRGTRQHTVDLQHGPSCG